MRVFITGFVNSHASPELRRAYAQTALRVTEVAREFENHRDPRRLVIVLACPCCRETPILDEPDSVLVSPLPAVETTNHKIAVVRKNPPHSTLGLAGEASTEQEYLDEFRDTIVRALA